MLTIGSVLVCGALLAFARLILVFRRPEPPRWTTRAGVGEVVTIALVTLLTFGVGYLGAGVIHALQRGVDLLDVALSLAAFAGAVVAWQKLDMRGRLKIIGRPEIRTVPAPLHGRPLVEPGAGPPNGHPAKRAA